MAAQPSAQALDGYAGLGTLVRRHSESGQVAFSESPGSGSRYLLRHTFALKQLSKPENTDAEVAAWLGVEDGEMKRYRGLITAPVDAA